MSSSRYEKGVFHAVAGESLIKQLCTFKGEILISATDPVKLVACLLYALQFRVNVGLIGPDSHAEREDVTEHSGIFIRDPLKNRGHGVSAQDSFRDGYPVPAHTTSTDTMSQEERPVLLILGAGAVGLSLAGKLADVASVHVACRPRHAEAIRQQGLDMKGIWGDRTVAGISCIAGADEALPSPDYVFITAKGTDTLAICEEYSGVIRNRPVISLQNGIGNEEIIASFTSIVRGDHHHKLCVGGPGNGEGAPGERPGDAWSLVHRNR